MKNKFQIIVCAMLTIMLAMGFIACNKNANIAPSYLNLTAENNDITLDSVAKTVKLSFTEPVTWSLKGGNDKDDDINNDTSYDATGKLEIISSTDKEAVIRVADGFYTDAPVKFRVFATLKSDTYRYGFKDITVTLEDPTMFNVALNDVVQNMAAGNNTGAYEPTKENGERVEQYIYPFFYYADANGYMDGDEGGIMFNYYALDNLGLGYNVTSETNQIPKTDANGTEYTPALKSPIKSYIAIDADTMASEGATSVELIITAKASAATKLAILSDSVDNTDITKVKRTIKVIGEADVAEEKAEFKFIVPEGKKVLIANGGANGTNLYIYNIKAVASAEEYVEVEDGKPVITSFTVAGSTEVFIGKQVTLSANIKGKGDPNTNVTWKSSNPSVATVNENGVVSGVSAGTATITATSVHDTTKTASLEISVTEGVITSYTFDFTKGIENIVAEEDATKTLTLTGCGFQDAKDYGAKKAGTATFDVTGPALITFYPTYKMEGTVTLYATGDTTTPLADATISTGGNDAKIPKAGTGEVQDPLLYAKSVMYTGDAATLDLDIAGSNVYFWKIVVTYPTANTFDFTKGITDIVAEEDATKTLTLTGCGFQDAKDYGAKNAGTAKFDVTGPALITFYPTYKMEGTVTLYATGDTTTPLAEATISTAGNDAKIPKAGTGEVQDPLLYAKSLMYTGDAATLDLAIAGSNVYFWKIVVNQF